MTFLFWILFICLCFFFFFRDTFLSELAISFLPYFFFFCWTLWICLFLVWIFKKAGKKYFFVIEWILFILFSILCGKELYQFYRWEEFDIQWEIDEETNHQGQEILSWTKIFYANILYTNLDYENIQHTIESENPDIVILVEFSDNHKEHMEQFFKTRYPYMSRNSWSETLAWDIIFSKYPLENIQIWNQTTPRSRTYSLLKMNLPQYSEWILFLVIHTAAPVSPKNFTMRNNQLEKIINDWSEISAIPLEKLIIGDFNLSPRSHYYQTFIDSLNQYWKDLIFNRTRNQKIIYTWSLFWQKIFRSHIDQLFTTRNLPIHDFDIKDFIGSDHRYFTFTIH